MSRHFRSYLLIMVMAGVTACGGDGTTQPAPPPPPGPPPPPPVGVTLDLQPGETRVLSDVASIRGFKLRGANEMREYQVIMMSASQVEGAVTPLRFVIAAQGAGSNVVPRAQSTPAATRLRSTGAGRTALERARLRPHHLRLMAQAEEELRRVGARVSPKARGGRPGPGLQANTVAASAVPTVGQIITIKSATLPGGGLTCSSSIEIDGVVKTVGDNFVIVEDPAVAGHLTAQDYAELDTELDAFVAPVDDAYFGVPGDLDGNGRVIAFFTAQVNRLAPPGAPSFPIGFFTSLDLADPVDCPSSNEAEILWLIGPDPSGSIGATITVSFLKSIARSLVAHEYQHLLNAEQRIVLGGGDLGDFEDIWLNEAMSHIAEEVNGFFRIGVSTRTNLGFTEIGIGSVEQAAFLDFHFGNFRNVVDYLESPTTVASLSVGNPPNSFPMRGWGYMFLRWLGDRYAPATPESLVGGSAEDMLFRELSTGGPAHLRGIDNVLRAVNVVSGESPVWADVLSEYFAAPASDDAAGGPPPEIQFSTWDFPRLFDEFQANAVPTLSGGYPLMRTNVAMGSGARSSGSFELGSSTARYFQLSAAGSHPDMIVEFTAPSGANVPNGARARIIVVRTR